MSKKLFQVPESTRLEACQFFGRSKKEADDDVKTIIRWFSTQPHLPETMSIFTLFYKK